MTQTTTEPVAEPGPPPAAPQQASAPAPDAAPPAQPLEYANAWPEVVLPPGEEAVRVFWRGVRRVVFAGGAGLSAWGVAMLVAGGTPYAGAFGLGWGVFFVAVAWPERRALGLRGQGGCRGPGVRAGCGAECGIEN